MFIHLSSQLFMTSFKILATDSKGTNHFLSLECGLGFNLASREDKIKTFDGWNIETQCCVRVGLPMPNPKGKSEPMDTSEGSLSRRGSDVGFAMQNFTFG